METQIRKYLPKEFYEGAPTNIPAILGAVDSLFNRLENLTQACIDQGFIQTASGRYLIQLGEEQGFVMPSNSGLDIRAYRTLIPVMVADPKQVRPTLNSLIKSFYSSEKTNSGVLSSVFGPYSLLDGDDLIVATESGTINISVTASQVSDLNNVSAAEIASIINTNQQLIIATQVVDRATAQEYLKLTSNTVGTSSKIRVSGGKLQNVLKFPNIVSTLNATGTVWNLTKPNSYSDELTFTWDGTGTNPEIYKAKSGDSVTIRGLVDGVSDFSNINGSYVISDIGYDYFVVKNTQFSDLSATLTQPEDNSIVFTSSDFISLYDKSEYAFTSETDNNTVRITAPAIPPLSRRFLAGATHFHGNILPILDFSRTSITLQTNTSGDRPNPENAFLFRSKRYQLSARHPYYRTSTVDTNLATPTYQLDISDEDDAIFPYTMSAAISSNPILATVNSPYLRVNFPYRHGFEYAWGVTFTGATGSSNVLAGDLNKEHVVSKVIDKNTLEITLKNSDGTLKPYAGELFGPADITRYATPQANGSDFYMTFATVPEANAFSVGLTFRLNTSGGTDVVAYLAQPLRYLNLVVTEISGNVVSFNAGLDIGPEGSVITGVSGRRSAFIGGSLQHYLDKTSAHNQSEVFDLFEAVFIGYSDEQNPAFVGSYIYDPDGDQTTVTVSKYLVKLDQTILKGDTYSSLEVNTIDTTFGQFPQSGLLVLDYGRNSFEGPIRYYAISSSLSSSQIIIDPAYRFKFAHSVGASVQYIHKNQAYIPDLLGAAYPTYVTGTSQARNTMFLLAEGLVAAGIFIEQNVLLPDLRYLDPAISPFE